MPFPSCQSFAVVPVGESVHCPLQGGYPLADCLHNPLSQSRQAMSRENTTHTHTYATIPCIFAGHGFSSGHDHQSTRTPSRTTTHPSDRTTARPHVDDDRQREMFALLSDVRVCGPCGQPRSSSGRSTSGTATTKVWARASVRELYTSSSEGSFSAAPDSHQRNFVFSGGNELTMPSVLVSHRRLSTCSSLARLCAKSSLT